MSKLDIGDHQIIAIDPGGTTGIAVLAGSTTGSYEIRGRYNACEHFTTLLDELDVDYVVAEEWVIDADTHKKAAEYDGMYLIGAMEYIATKRGIPFEIRSRANKKRVPNRALKGFGVKGSAPMEGHADDAWRHLIAFAVEHGMIPPADLIMVLSDSTEEEEEA